MVLYINFLLFVLFYGGTRCAWSNGRASLVLFTFRVPSPELTIYYTAGLKHIIGILWKPSIVVLLDNYRLKVCCACRIPITPRHRVCLIGEVVESTLEQYGIDWDGSCPDNEADGDCVTVPRILKFTFTFKYFAKSL